MPVYDEWVLRDLEASESDIPSVESPIVRRLLREQGVVSEQQFRLFTSPRVGDLHDAATIHGMSDACERIERAIRERRGILIYGDYDVDGVTSIVLLRTVLRALGSEAQWVVPHRIYDGYGLTIPVLDRMLDDGRVSLVVTVDCGITSVDAVEHAIDRGIEVIITDHHLPPESLPAAAAVLNPKQEGCRYPFKDLAGVGVAFKLCCELLRRAGHTMSIESLAKIAALGTIADVAPLCGENRSIVRIGLQGLADARNPGLRALLRSLGLLGRPLRASDVGFRIGPRLNAAGRIASANTAVDLFECRADSEAVPLVAELERLNTQRRTLQGRVLEEARAEFEARADEKLLIAAGAEWHQGVLGLCAGRIAEEYQRPTLLARIGEEECVGSGRSPAGIDLHGLLKGLDRYFSRWGGHARACGFTVPRERWEEFAAAAREASRGLRLPKRRLEIAASVELEAVTDSFLRELSLLEPWGEGNPEPLFVASGVRLRRQREFSPGCFEVELEQEGALRRAVVWPSEAPLLQDVEAGSSFECVFRVEEDRYRGGTVLVLVDLKRCRG
jgi:single-stranded-DNA-specific exonuclease